MGKFGVCVRAQLAQVRQAASSLERVAAAMARQAAKHHGDGRVAYTVGPVEGHEHHALEGGRRSSLGQRFSLP